MKKNRIKNFIIDADGVLTDGSFYYSAKGKILKRFGPDDSDAFILIRDKLNVVVVTGDKKGFPITKKRVAEDMHLKLRLVSTFERIGWIKKRFDPKATIYMGDGLFDSLIFDKVAYSIAPANALDVTKRKANYVTKRRGGEGAVAEAIIHILKTFFDKNLDLAKVDFSKGSGAWKK